MLFSRYQVCPAKHLKGAISGEERQWKNCFNMAGGDEQIFPILTLKAYLKRGELFQQRPPGTGMNGVAN